MTKMVTLSLLKMVTVVNRRARAASWDSRSEGCSDTRLEHYRVAFDLARGRFGLTAAQ